MRRTRLRERRRERVSVFVHIGEDSRPAVRLVVDSPQIGIGALDLKLAELERLRGEFTRAAAILREFEGT